MESGDSHKETKSNKIITSFLNKMQKYPDNKVNIIKAFEDTFLGQISLEIDSIKKLFYGSSTKGLLEMAADKEESYLVSFHIVSLLAKLLDPKKNPYSESFKKIFEDAETETLERIVIKMKHYAVMSKSINFEKSHLVKCLDWLQNSSIRSKSKIFMKSSSTLKQDHSDPHLMIDDVLENNDKELYKQWKMFAANESFASNAKSTMSLLSQNRDGSNTYMTRSKYSEKSISNVPKKPSDEGKSLLDPNRVSNVETSEGTDDQILMADIDELPFLKKAKSVNNVMITNDLKGKKARFSVMKVMSDEAKEKARKLANTIAESILLEQDKEKSGESNFNVPSGIK